MYVKKQYGKIYFNFCICHQLKLAASKKVLLYTKYYCKPVIWKVSHPLYRGYDPVRDKEQHLIVCYWKELLQRQALLNNSPIPSSHKNIPYWDQAK